ncbi:MAG: hypothetical protein ACR2FU_06885 [Streptosporangiaceae bacterium]
MATAAQPQLRSRARPGATATRARRLPGRDGVGVAGALLAGDREAPEEPDGAGVALPEDPGEPDGDGDGLPLGPGELDGRGTGLGVRVLVGTGAGVTWWVAGAGDWDPPGMIADDDAGFTTT